MTVHAKIVPVPRDLGGRNVPFFVGLKATLRLQSAVRSWLKEARDVQVTQVALHGDTANISFRFARETCADQLGVKVGDLIELLEGYRVIAVGNVLELR